MSSLMCHTLSVLFCVLRPVTPHERFFGFSRRSSTGASISTWLASPGPVYIKRQVRTSKMDPLVHEVELLQANPHYAHERYPDGRETTIATKHLAPNVHSKVVETLPAAEHIPAEAENLPLDTPVSVTPDAESLCVPEPAPKTQPETISTQNVDPAPVRRSQRIRRPVIRLNF